MRVTVQVHLVPDPGVMCDWSEAGVTSDLLTEVGVLDVSRASIGQIIVYTYVTVLFVSPTKLEWHSRDVSWR